MSHIETVSIEDRAASWSQYWGTGAAWSCGDLGLEDKDSDAYKFWDTTLNSLQTSDSILEIGAGNGAFVHILRRIFGNQTIPAYMGVDLADIRPNLTVHEGEQVQFQGETDVTQLNFDSNQYTAAISQYCLEYTPLEESLTQLSHCLKTEGATLAMVMHHADSALVSIAKEDINHLSLILSEEGILHSVKNMIPFAAMAATPEGKATLKDNPEAEQARATFNDKMKTLQQLSEHAQSPSGIHHAAKSAHEILFRASQQGEEQAQHFLDTVKKLFEDERKRLIELAQCAKDQESLDKASALLKQLGFNQIEIDELYREDKKMAWSLVAKR